MHSTGRQYQAFPVPHPQTPPYFAIATKIRKPMRIVFGHNNFLIRRFHPLRARHYRRRQFGLLLRSAATLRPSVLDTLLRHWQILPDAKVRRSQSVHHAGLDQSNSRRQISPQNTMVHFCRFFSYPGRLLHLPFERCGKRQTMGKQFLQHRIRAERLYSISNHRRLLYPDLNG